MNNKSDCHSYILRFWSDENANSAGNWRFSLTEIDTKQHYGFRSLLEFISFLTRKTLRASVKLLPSPGE